MLYTSYFARLKQLPPNVIPVSICGKAPSWYTGQQYKKLAPKYSFFAQWKENHDNDFYVQHFNAEVLEQLEFLRVINELQLLLPYDIRCVMNSSFFDNSEWHIALICYEKPSDFCHRHLVAEWFKAHGIHCEEYQFQKESNR